MTTAKDESYRQVVSKAAIHSQHHRHSDYSSRELSPKAIQEIGFKLVNLYEELFEQHTGKGEGGVSPKGGTPTDPNDGEPGRVVTRPQPYR